MHYESEVSARGPLICKKPPGTLGEFLTRLSENNMVSFSVSFRFGRKL